MPVDVESVFAKEVEAKSQIEAGLKDKNDFGELLVSYPQLKLVGFPSADSVGFTEPGLSASIGRTSPLTGTLLPENWKVWLEP
jgi:hypothetical protein